MVAADPDPVDEYTVVVNDEDQYSIWPTTRRVPLGWSETGDRGSRQHCLDRIGELWQDMRPRGLRPHLTDVSTVRRADR